MRLFVTEFITGGGLANHPLPEGLKQEGLLMLNAVLSDCSLINNIQLVTCLDARITLTATDVEVHTIDTSSDYMNEVTRLAKGSDYVWVIAPESAGVLESVVAELTEQEIPTINCDAESIRLTGDKLKCSNCLTESGIKTTVNLSQEEALEYPHQVVIKNRYGVGCEGLKLCDSGMMALECIDEFNQWVVQPYIEGEHLSVCLLCHSGESKVLACNKQLFSDDLKEPRLQACHVNAVTVNKDIEALMTRITKAFPGLKGYVGIDLIKTDDEYIVVDINPRLTSSYVGLKDVLIDNPAELCINTIIKNNLPENVMRNNKTVEVNLVSHYASSSGTVHCGRV